MKREPEDTDAADHVGINHSGATIYLDEDPARDLAEAATQAMPEAPGVVPHVVSTDRHVPSRHSHRTATTSACSRPTLASAQAAMTTQHCFLPTTVFRRSTGEYVRAAELANAGGDRLCAPHGASTVVQRASRCQTIERDFVSLRIGGCNGAFVVTADHRLMSCGPVGEETTQTAFEIALRFQRGEPSLVHDGQAFRSVESASNFKERASVVQVWFVSDAPALVFLLPRRKRAASLDGTALAVFGETPTARHRGAFIHRGFWEVERTAATRPRALSCGAEPPTGSCWSVGTIAHPNCGRACEEHRLYLASLRSGHAAEPCHEGAGCRRCHHASHQR